MNFWLKHEGEVHNAEDRSRGAPLQMGIMSPQDIQQPGKATAGEIKDLDCTATVKWRVKEKCIL